MMKVLIWIVVVVVVGLVGVAVYMRVAPVAAAWDDPLTVTPPDSPNSWLVRPEGGNAAAPVYALSASELGAKLDGIIQGEPRTEKELVPERGGSASMGVFVQRSRVFGFPDVITFRAIPLTDDTSTLAIYSHAIYGYSDMGVNKARVEKWLAALAPFIQEG